MRKIVLNFIETILIIIIALICVVSILQSTLLENKAIFGYRSYVIASNSMYPVLKYGDVILVKEIPFDSIKKGDIITYRGKEGEVKNKIITHEVIDILTEENTTVLKTQGRANTGVDPYVYKEQVIGKYEYRFLLFSAISKVIRDKVGFVICILIPFSILFVLELISVTKEVKRKEFEVTMQTQLEELKNINSNSELSKAIEDVISEQLLEIKKARRDFKKIDELERTIQVPLEEIQKQIAYLNSKLTKEPQEDNKDLDQTVVLPTSDDIRLEIEKELERKKSTTTVDKKKKKAKKSTTSVEKKKTKKEPGK